MYCLGFAKHEDDLVFIQKTHPRFQYGKLNGVGGHIEGQETPVEAMVREFEEEAGVATSQTQWLEKGKIALKGALQVFVFETELTVDQFTEVKKQALVLKKLSELNSKPTVEKIHIVDKSLINRLHDENKLMYNVKNILCSKGKNNTYF